MWKTDVFKATTIAGYAVNVFDFIQNILTDISNLNIIAFLLQKGRKLA